MSEEERAHWEERYRTEGRRPTEPSRFVVEKVSQLGPPGTAIDVAGGAGRNALWLAAQGWKTTLVDVSPTALRLATEDAERAALTFETECVDLDEEFPSGGPWNLVVIAHYLNRDLLAAVPHMLTERGYLVMVHPTVRNLERHDRPSRRFLLDEGEVSSLLAGLDVVSLFEGWTPEGRHEAQVVARRT